MNIGVLTMEGERSWTRLIDTDAVEAGPRISPDGRWITYMSSDTGRWEVYVQRFPELGLRQPISTDGGMDPIWSPDGRALFYLGTRGGGDPDEMVVVTIDPGPPLSVGIPEVLFDIAPYVRDVGGGHQYDLDPNGQRFLMLTDAAPGDAGPALPPQINVVMNWFEELERLVPTK